MKKIIIVNNASFTLDPIFGTDDYKITNASGTTVGYIRKENSGQELYLAFDAFRELTTATASNDPEIVATKFLNSLK